MSDENLQITQLLNSAAGGDRNAAADLLPLVYDELRRLANARLSKAPPGQTLQPTALVHEAYLKLVGNADPGWDSRGHFFGAAARAMRDILVDQARRKGAAKRGGDRSRIEESDAFERIQLPAEDLLALDEALNRLEVEDPRKAQMVMLRYFAGLSPEETAAALGVHVRTVQRDWRYIVARLHRELFPLDEENATS